MNSKVYSRKRSVWSVSCYSFIISSSVSFKILLNSSLWVCSSFTIYLEGSRYFSHKSNHTSRGVYGLCKTPTIFDPLKPTLLQLWAPVSRGNILPTPVLSINLLTSSLFYLSTQALNSPSHLMTYIWLLLKQWSFKSWYQGYEGSAQGMVTFPLFLFSLPLKDFQWGTWVA